MASHLIPRIASRHLLRSSVRCVTLSRSHQSRLVQPATAQWASLETRYFSETTKPAAEESAEAPEEEEQPGAEPAGGEDSSENDGAQQLEEEVKDLKDQLLRSLAEQENTRRIAKRDVDSARQFAIKSFAKALLETSDNLSRALEAVPEDVRKDKQNIGAGSIIRCLLREQGNTK